jgi:hypothetical protein
VPAVEHINAIKSRMDMARTLALEPYEETTDPDDVEAAPAPKGPARKKF